MRYLIIMRIYNIQYIFIQYLIQAGIEMTNNEFFLLNSKLITVFRQYGIRELYNP